MKWLLVSRQHAPAHGGIGTYVQRFCQAARSRGWHVELMTQPGDEWPPCARVHEVRTADMDETFAIRVPELRRRHVIRPYRYALWSVAVAERLQRIAGDFDAIEFVDCQAEGFAAIGSETVRRRHARSAFIVHAHTPMWVEESINGADATIFGRGIYHDWERRALSLADGVIVTSRTLGEAIGPVANIIVIPYPMEDDAPPSRSPREQRIVLIGSVQPRKGVDVWAQSLNEVLLTHPKATAMLIGPDTPSAPDGGSMAAHVRQLLDRRVVDRFHWPGSLHHDQVRDLVATSALLVVPSRLESFSFAAAEALLAGTPVIVSDRTGIAEHVASLPVVPHDDPGAWADVQTSALDDPIAAMAIAADCRREMLRSCSPESVSAKREQMIGELPRQGSIQRVAATGDCLAEMSAFIAGVDSSLSSPADCSMARS